MVLKDNTMVTQGMKAIPELLTTPHMRGYLVIPNDLYRPLSLVLLAAEYQFFGTGTAGYHFFNVLIFAGCVLVVLIELIRWPSHEKSSSKANPTKAAGAREITGNPATGSSRKFSRKSGLSAAQTPEEIIKLVQEEIKR